MQGDQSMTDESGLWTTLKGLSSWIATAIATFVSNINAQSIAVWLSIAYTTLLIYSWFRKEFKAPPRHVRATDVAETMHAKKVVVVIDSELPEVPHVPGQHHREE